MRGWTKEIWPKPYCTYERFFHLRFALPCFMMLIVHVSIGDCIVYCIISIKCGKLSCYNVDSHCATSHRWVIKLTSYIMHLTFQDYELYRYPGLSNNMTRTEVCVDSTGTLHKCKPDANCYFHIILNAIIK